MKSPSQPPATTARPNHLPHLMTPSEVANILRTTRKAIYIMVERGQLPSVTRIGRRILFRTDLLLGSRGKTTEYAHAHRRMPVSDRLTRMSAVLGGLVGRRRSSAGTRLPHHTRCGSSLGSRMRLKAALAKTNNQLSLIRFRGHFPKGGYDVQNGTKEAGTATTAAVHGRVHGRRGPARVG